MESMGNRGRWLELVNISFKNIDNCVQLLGLGDLRNHEMHLDDVATVMAKLNSVAVESSSLLTVGEPAAATNSDADPKASDIFACKWLICT